MTEEQKRKIADAGMHCERARGFAAHYAKHGDLDEVHFWVEIARHLSDHAFALAAQS